MRLLDESFNHLEKENALRSLDGCICRICVSEDPLEIVRMVGFVLQLGQTRESIFSEIDFCVDVEVLHNYMYLS